MNELETAIYLIKLHAKHTISITKQLTFSCAKECATITATEVQNQFEIEHDPGKFLFWEKVIKQIPVLTIEQVY